MAISRSRSVFTNSISLYSDEACLDFGFVNRSGFLKISNIFPDMKDKRARKGVPMYDRDAALMSTLSLPELVWIKNNFEELIKGEIEAKAFSHSYGEDIKVITVGVNVMNLGSKDDDPMGSRECFGVMIELFDRQDGKDSKPLDSKVFLFNSESAIPIQDNITADHMIMSEWIDAAIRSIMMDGVHALSMYNNSYNNNNNDGGNGGYRSRGRYRDGNRDGGRDYDDEDYNDDRGSRPRYSRDSRDDRRSRSSDRGGVSNRNSRTSEETEGDQVPF